MKTILDQKTGANWTAAHGDCIEAIRDIPDNSIDFSVYSPPYSSLYIYSESERDMGNVDDDEQFMQFYSLLIREKLRVTRPGRLSAIHVKDLVYYQGSSSRGDSGIRPFSDMCVAEHIAQGWSYHCRITIWRDPVLERGKTNAHGLLRKTRRADSTFCRVGMPEYLLVFRKWAISDEEKALARPVSSPDYPTELWQQEASPIWDGNTIWNYDIGQSGKGDFDLPATNVLNVKAARDQDVTEAKSEIEDAKEAADCALEYVAQDLECIRQWIVNGRTDDALHALTRVLQETDPSCKRTGVRALMLPLSSDGGCGL